MVRRGECDLAFAVEDPSWAIEWNWTRSDESTTSVNRNFCSVTIHSTQKQANERVFSWRGKRNNDVEDDKNRWRRGKNVLGPWREQNVTPAGEVDNLVECVFQEAFFRSLFAWLSLMLKSMTVLVFFSLFFRSRAVTKRSKENEMWESTCSTREEKEKVLLNLRPEEIRQNRITSSDSFSCLQISFSTDKCTK